MLPFDTVPFSALVGKTIESVSQMAHGGFPQDTGYLVLRFNDGSSYILMGYSPEYDGTYDKTIHLVPITEEEGLIDVLSHIS